MTSNPRNLFRSEDGSATVELACILPVFLLLLIGVIDFALEIQASMRITEAAFAGAAYGTSTGKSNDLAGMQGAAATAAAGVNGFSATAITYWSCTPGSGSVSSSTLCVGNRTPMQWVQVDTAATVPVLLALPGVPAGLALHATAIDRVPWRP